MSELKCPFCQQELKCWDEPHNAIYSNWSCPNCRRFAYGNKLIWQELIRTRKALKIATGFIKGISQTIINDCDNQYVVLGNFKKFAQDTLNQIKTALEQKD